MPKPPLPLTALTSAQRAQAQERFEIIRPTLEDGVTQAQVARTHKIPGSQVQSWIKRYREKGFAGLANEGRSDKGKSRRLPAEAITLIEGLAEHSPPRSMAAIHRQVVEIAEKRGWKPPSYDRVRQIIKGVDPALVTYAHQGAAAYREEFDLLYRREVTHANAMWQADHTELSVWLLDEAGKPAKPYLTAIEDDYSRMIVGYRLSFQPATALTTALTLRQAIWRKEDAHWSACGIPSVFYTDHGSDFTSKHMEQVAVDIGMELVFSEKGVPRGRGKIERFFRSVDQLFLQDVPGYAPKGYGEAEATLTLPAFEQRFRTWLLEDYHHRVHSETEYQPKERWEAGGFVPRMPTSMAQLDLLLLTVAKTRRVQQDGIHFLSHRYMDITLAAFVKEDVLIRYDPADLGEIHVFYQDRFLCRAVCAELSDRKVSLKEIEKARSERRKQVRTGLSKRAALVDQLLEVHHESMPLPKTLVAEPAPVEARPRRKAGTSMTSQNGEKPPANFVETKSYRRFGEMCDGCRRTRVVGLGYGPPGTGKTESAKQYTQWSLFKPFLPEPLITFTGRSAADDLYPYRPLTFASAPLDASMQQCRTVFYTPPVSASVARIERQVLTLFAAFTYLVEAANQHHRGKEEFLVTPHFSHLIELLIVDEANRLKDAALELIRDFSDRGEFGLVLLGMPGLDKRLKRAPQLYSRIGFAQEMVPLPDDETRDFLSKRWSHRVKAYSDDYTDKEAVAAILRITRGNIRVIERLMMQVEHVLAVNQMSVVTKEVVETARDNLILGD